MLRKIKSFTRFIKVDYIAQLYKLNSNEWVNLLYLIKDYIDWISFNKRCRLEEDEWGIVCPASIGDTYYSCAFAEEFKKQHPGDKFVIIVKKDHSYIPTLFPSIDRIIVVDNIPIRALIICSSFKRGMPIFGHFKDTSFNNILGYQSINLLDLHRAVLYLPMSSKLSEPKIIRKNKKKMVKDFFISNNLIERKTLILFPTANTIKLLDPSIWINIAERAKERGWIVCCNSINKNDCIKGTINLDFKLEDLIPICENAGWVIMLRSGLCDMISNAKVKKTILYNKEYKIFSGPTGFIPYAIDSASILDAVGLKALGIAEDVEEYVVTTDNHEEIIKNIFN